jgi:hypothetical protein
MNMAADLSKLTPEFHKKINVLLNLCQAKGFEMRPYTALRTPEEQAKLWRQSRRIDEINKKIAQLIAGGAPYLAGVLKDVGPQNGKPVTNAIPGLSWHQWGEAVDCFWLVNGDAEWSATKKINGINGYQSFAAEAESIGLTAGGLWPNFKDWPHIQLSQENSPTTVMTLPEIDKEMKKRFG